MHSAPRPMLDYLIGILMRRVAINTANRNLSDAGFWQSGDGSHALFAVVRLDLVGMRVDDGRVPVQVFVDQVRLH